MAASAWNCSPTDFENACSDRNVQPEVIMVGAAAIADMRKRIPSMPVNFPVQHRSTALLGQLLLRTTPM
jgi:hypothetical protein